MIKIITISFFTAVFILFPPAITFAAPQTADQSLTVTATIRKPLIRLFGYTSPMALVQLQIADSEAVEETIAAVNGLFSFENIYYSAGVKELCLIAYDRQNRTTSPVCIPAPVTFSNEETGPVILPPSLSLSRGKFLPKDIIEGRGESIPNTEIKVSLFQAKPNLVQRIFRFESYAASLPEYTIKTDQNGYYSFNLPSSASNTYRLFTQAHYLNSPSPKSNTLTYKILGFFEYLWELLCLLFVSLLALFNKLPFWESVIILQITIVFYLLGPKKKSYNR